jgi:hypothetical protein
MLEYKVVETSIVTDDELELIINEWVSKGWQFDGIQFSTRDSSKRPAMAFVLFTRRVEDEEAEEAGD